MLKVFTIITFCLLASHCDGHQHVIRAPVASDCETTAEFTLCQDFRDIRNLIDANTLVYYISAGYRNDENFRRAMDFIKTDNFQSVSQQIADSNAYQRILRHFSDAGLNTESIASISNIFNCIMISMPKYGDEEDINNLEMQPILVSRTLQDVATNLMNSIPRSDFRSLIRDKLRNNSDFAKFYRIVRSNSFKREVKKLLSSYQLRYPLKVLKRHNIDLVKLAKMVNQIFEWGPYNTESW